MKRALPAVTITIAGLAAVLAFRTREIPTAVTGVAASTTTTSAGATTSGGATTTTAPPGGEVRVTGPVVNTEYGPVQVEVVISGGRLQNVIALQLPTDDPHSDRINARAEPILREAALSAQSANIDVVSGATVTWSGYTRSLQAALDSAGF
jgi:uncharacterized protein with FMN-binding domain